MRNRGVGGWPARRAQMSPGRPAFVYGDATTTFADVYDRATRLAERLRSAGVRHGDRVAYLGPNHPAFAETLFATHLLGGVFVPLNWRLADPEISYLVEHSGASVLVRAPNCPAPSDPASLRAVVALSDPAPGEIDYEPWVRSGDPTPIDEPVEEDEPALILYTSGTTGRPKGAILTHANIVWNCVNIMIGVDVASDDVTLISAPLFHVAALNQTLLPTYLKGGCSVIMPRWDVDSCYELMAKHRITWMFGVTTMFGEFARSPRWDTADLSSLRNLMCGGAPVPPALIRTFQDRGLVFCQGYGLTETAPGATFLEARESVTKAGSAGVPVFFADVRVVRPDLTDVEVGEPGEVLVRGPNVTPGYWGDPAATAAAFTDGWFHSGDIATVDPDGHLYIVDRLKDMYISGGENVYPAEVEGVLFEHAAVAECAIIGVPHARWGEVGKAFVVLRPGATAGVPQLQQHLGERLAKYKVPLEFELVDALPRTGSGKVLKARLRAGA
ncbi:MAG: fatty-acyl-CoA synthase [Pseudonocardiales bacterium]|nr:fatty-acyl-CoA synthase [Pseudonocardiales bacterium]